MKLIQKTPVDKSDFIAVVSTYMGKDSLRVFAMGFLEMTQLASDKLVTNSCSIDAVVPAALSSLRHSVELFLKYVLYDLKVVREKQPIHGHAVGDIFNKSKVEITNAFECEPSSGFHWREWLADFDDLIQAVQEIDPDGQQIRYPANKKLIPNQGNEYSFSTKNFHCCLVKVYELYLAYDQRNC